MVNFHDPATVARDYLTLLKLWHVVDGVYIWEFFTTLDYELSVIRGRRPYRWTIWVFSLARMSTLLVVIFNMIGMSVTGPKNCQAWITSSLAFAYITLAASSLLIVLRTIAIWNRNKLVIILAMTSWLTSISFSIQGIVRCRAAWSPLQGTCAVLNIEVTKPAILATLANDMTLLLIMLVCLLRLRLEGGTFGLVRLLWTQGIMWLFLATVAEVLPSVFICLHINDPYDSMFQMPGLVVMSIAATRLYRSLTDFGSSDICCSRSQQDGFQSGPIVFEAKQVPVAPFSHNWMEVELHTSRDGSYITSMDKQLGDKPSMPSLGDDVESEK